MGNIHTTMPFPVRPVPVPMRTPVPVPPKPATQRSLSSWPPSKPFNLGLRLADVTFPGGIAALPVLFFKAPGGAFGKVLIGSFAGSGIPAAVKLLLGAGGDLDTNRAAFLQEANNLLKLRGDVDVVRELEARGSILTLEDSGALHVAYVYGAGEEQDLAAINPSLPPGPAFLLAVEPLSETLTQRMRRSPDGRLPLPDALHAAYEIALGLAFLAKHGIVVRGLCVALYMPV